MLINNKVEMGWHVALKYGRQDFTPLEWQYNGLLDWSISKVKKYVQEKIDFNFVLPWVLVLYIASTYFVGKSKDIEVILQNL